MLTDGSVKEVDDTLLFVKSLTGQINFDDYEELPDPPDEQHNWIWANKNWVRTNDTKKL